LPGQVLRERENFAHIFFINRFSQLTESHISMAGVGTCDRSFNALDNLFGG
jgi:hypothetical protein